MNFDSEFIKLLVTQDEFAFARFYEQSVDDFFRYIMSHYTLSEQESHDIVSEVYLKIWENLDKYDEKYEFWQFVRWILKNHCKDYFKKAKPLLLSQLSDDVQDETKYHRQNDSANDLFDFSVDAMAIKESLLTLDAESQELIHAKFVLGYDYDTIADIYAITSDNVRKKISRILQKLRLNTAHTQ